MYLKTNIYHISISYANLILWKIFFFGIALKQSQPVAIFLWEKVKKEKNLKIYYNNFFFNNHFVLRAKLMNRRFKFTFK